MRGEQGRSDRNGSVSNTSQVASNAISADAVSGSKTERTVHLRQTIVLAALIAGATQQACAQDRPGPRSSHLLALEACQRMADGQQRLACLDSAVASLLLASSAGQVSLVDQQSARAVRRSLFGFSVPNLAILGNDKEGDARELTAKVRSASATGDGRFRIRLDDGALWETVERPRAGEGPRAGSVVRLRRAMLGSFFMNIDDHRAVRARRVEY